MMIPPSSSLTNKQTKNGPPHIQRIMPTTLHQLNETLTSPPNAPKRLMVADDCSTAASDISATCDRQGSQNAAAVCDSSRPHPRGQSSTTTSQMPSSTLNGEPDYCYCAGSGGETFPILDYSKRVNIWDDDDEADDDDCYSLGSDPLVVDPDLQNTVISSLENILIDDV